MCSPDFAKFLACMVCLGTATSSTKLCTTHRIWLDDKLEAEMELEVQTEKLYAALFTTIPNEAFAHPDLWVQ